MKVHLSPHAICETARSGLFQILCHSTVSKKITPLYFCSSNLEYFAQKMSIEMKFSDFWVVEWKLTKFPMSDLKPQVSISLNFTSLFSVVRDKRYELFQQQLFMIWTKGTICTFIGFFCWKYIKFQLIKYRGVIPHGTDEWCKNLQKN